MGGIENDNGKCTVVPVLLIINKSVPLGNTHFVKRVKKI